MLRTRYEERRSNSSAVFDAPSAQASLYRASLFTMMPAPDFVLSVKNQVFRTSYSARRANFYEVHDPCGTSALGASVVVDGSRLADRFRRILLKNSFSGATRNIPGP
jgi:hypothetical protein